MGLGVSSPPPDAREGQGPAQGQPLAPPPPTRFGHSPLRVAVEVGVVLGALALVLLLIVPWVAGLVVAGLPLSTDRAVGEVAAQSFAAGQQVCTNPVPVQAVEQVVAALSAELDPGFEPVKVWVIDSEEVNAFALPGGFVFVMSGLLKDLRSADELAGVLGHELGHVALRHGMTRVARQSAWGVLTLWLLGGSAGSLDSVAAASVGLVALRFDRDQETESDDYGAALLTRAGISPHGLADFFERLPEGPVPAWFLTHPEPTARAQRLRARLGPRPMPPETSPLPPLEALQAPCQLSGGGGG
jgi:predicted Zn-dependent protease